MTRISFFVTTTTRMDIALDIQNVIEKYAHNGTIVIDELKQKIYPYGNMTMTRSLTGYGIFILHWRSRYHSDDTLYNFRNRLYPTNDEFALPVKVAVLPKNYI